MDAARRPGLTAAAADDLLLRLVLQALGTGHYLDAAAVCKSWKEAYSTHVQQSPLTCCKPYLQDEALWSYIKELSLHESIPAALIGQYGCDAALVDTVGLPYCVQLTAYEGLQRADMPSAYLLNSSSHSKLWSPVVQHWEVYCSDREADDALHAAHSAFCTTEKLQSEQLVLDVAAGAARGGWFVLFADVLLKWPQSDQKLQKLLVETLINCTASCKDTATFANTLRVLLVLECAHHPPLVWHVRSTIENLRVWHTAAVCHEQCDASRSLLQFEAVREQQSWPTYSTAAAQRSAAARVDLMWRSLSKSMVWALARNTSAPALHAHFVQICPQAAVEELILRVAQKGSAHVLEHLYERELLSSDALIGAINTGAVAGDKVTTVKWLQSHNLLADGITEMLQAGACNKRIGAHLTECGLTAAAAAE
jgi:hypothetical protein